MRTYHSENLGPTIAKLRDRAHMTQKELAEKVGVSNVFLSDVERGKKFPKVETLCLIAEALNVSCDALLYDEVPDAHLTTVNQLLAGKSLKYVTSIEDLIRICNQNFAEGESEPSE